MNTTFSLPQNLFLLNHPFYKAWVDGTLSREALQDYSRQYYFHVEGFPRYLKNALEICDSEDFRQILAENLAEEDGTIHGTAHPELWLQFAEGVGAPRSEVQTAPLRGAIKNVVATFTKFSKSSLHEALGALYAYESQVPEIAESKIEGLRAHFGIEDARTLCFFEVHKTADIEHRESLRKLIEQLTPQQKLEAERAAQLACQALWDFLTDVQTTNTIAA